MTSLQNVSAQNYLQINLYMIGTEFFCYEGIAQHLHLSSVCLSFVKPELSSPGPKPLASKSQTQNQGALG